MKLNNALLITEEKPWCLRRYSERNSYFQCKNNILNLLSYYSYSFCSTTEPCRLMDPGIHQVQSHIQSSVSTFKVWKPPRTETSQPLCFFLPFPRPNTAYNWFSLLSRINFTSLFLLVSCFNSYRNYEDNKVNESKNFGDTYTWWGLCLPTFVWNIVPYRFEKLEKL